jgi:ubiquitin-like 1-activating enzyme E1 B
VWDKDDDICLDFVTAAANLRAHIFGIPLKSRFDIKSMAGNIIPAIATTNAVIGGLIVVEALKVLDNRLEDCKTTYLNQQPVARNRLLSTCKLIPPNPKCYVCASKPEVLTWKFIYSYMSVTQDIGYSAFGPIYIYCWTPGD